MVQNPPRSPRRLLPSLLVAPPLLQALARRRRPPAPGRRSSAPPEQSPLRRLFSGSIWVLSSRRFAWTAMITAAPARFENRAKLLNMKEVPNFSAVRNSRTSS
ncbi:hypothetical protein NL676_030962 [Syzygium grande]|nr:hypothetical protein NL676_030962 [Syzygium grande]